MSILFSDITCFDLHKNLCFALPAIQMDFDEEKMKSIINHPFCLFFSV